MDALSDIDRAVLAARLRGYLGDHLDAVDLLDDALERHPGNFRLLHQRGCKRLLAHDIRGAKADLTEAAALLTQEPDTHEYYRNDVIADVIALVLGREPRREQSPRVTPESVADHRHVATGTVHSSVLHHLGVAHYLERDFASAAALFERAQQAAVEDHQRMSALDWQYMSLRRDGRRAEAGEALLRAGHLHFDPEELDSPSVRNSLRSCYLQRLMMYSGQLGPADLLRNESSRPLAVATLGYGVGNWYLYNGNPAAAERAFARVVELGEPGSLGYLAAQVEVNGTVEAPVANLAVLRLAR